MSDSSATERPSHGPDSTAGETCVRKCKNCGDPFKSRVADVRRGWAKFCSKSCKAREQTRRTGRGKPRPLYWSYGSGDYEHKADGE